MDNVDPRRRRKRLWLLLIPCLAAGLWSSWDAVSFATSLRVFVIPSASMSPTLVPGDRICVESRRSSPPKRGELWVFTMSNGSTAIKRVIGLPGETVQVADGRVSIDGTPLEEPYLATPMSYTMPPVHLGAGEYFMMGDSRNTSNDSHVWGPLPEERLIGRALYRCWPAGRLGELP
jgi:signal peptidase I